MKARLQMEMDVSAPSDAQRILVDVCEKLKREGAIAEYHFEIDTPHGVITEKCILDDERVIA